MGIVHFAPIGTNPGAVTAALAYVKHNPQEFERYVRRGEGDTDWERRLVETVVLFASHDVIEGETTVDECVFNQYGSLQGRQPWRRRDRPNIINIVQRFVEEEIVPVMPGRIYLWPVDPNNFDDCFDAVVEATLALGRADATGKHIWANLTGGTNVLNAALLEVVFLSGLIARIYYTFVPDESDKKYLQPPSKDPARFRWCWVPMIKTAFDEAYCRVLKVLNISGDWCRDSDLLGLLKADEASGGYFSDVTPQRFRNQFLNHMHGREELERDEPEGHLVRLASTGQDILRRIESPRFQALVQRGKGIEEEESEELKRGLKGRELWSKP
jgi:hypothetical protein